MLDNVGYHQAHLARSWWVARRGRVRPLWPPAYAPELNPTERVWRHLTGKLACHRHGVDLPGLQQAAAELLDRLQAHVSQRDPPIIRRAQDFRETA